MSAGPSGLSYSVLAVIHDLTVVAIIIAGPSGLDRQNLQTGATAMKLLTFSFNNEAMWMVIFEFAPIVVAFIIFLFVYLVRSLL